MRFLSARLLSLLFTVCCIWQLHAQPLELQRRVQVNAPHVQFSEPVQRWLERHSTLDVGVWGPEQPPLSEGMGHGVFEGIAADYLALLEDSLKIKIKLHYYENSKEMLLALQRQEIQMVAIWNPELWPSPDLQASPPWLLDKAVLMTRKTQGGTPADLRNKVVGIVAGSQASEALRHQYPESTLHFQSWYTTAVSSLAFKQIDALWINRASAEYLTQYHQVRDLSWTFSPTIPNLNMSFGIDRQLPLLAESIDTVFKHISLASRLRIATSWGLNRSFVITTNPLGLDPGEESWLREHGQIQVIIDRRQQPVTFVSEGEPQGLVVDLLNQFNEQYGIHFSLLSVDNDAEFQAMKLTHPDALFVEQVIDTPQQNKSGAAKTSPLLTTPSVVVMDQGIKRPSDFSQLKGEKIAIQTNNPLLSWLDTWYPTITLVKVPNMDDALERLKRGEVRGVIAPQFIANYLVTLHHPTRFHLAVTLPVTPVDLVLSAQTENSLPINIFNKALADMQPRALMQMAGDWRQATIENGETWNRSTFVNSLLWGISLLLVVVGCWLWIQYLRRALRRGNVWQQKLAEQLKFTQSLIDASPVALYVRDRQGNLLRYNQAWCDSIGLSGQDLKGLPITAINTIDPSELAAIEARYRQALQDGQPQKWSARFQVGEQPRYLQGWVVPWHDGQGEIGGLIGGWLDVTEKELLIAQLSETKSNLEQAIASKNAFMLSMGHEVRTPLNVITGLLELELQALDERHERNENLNLIWESSLNLLSLIGDMFDVFRADNPQLLGLTRSTNLPQLIDSTVALYRPQAEAKGLSLNVLSELSAQRYDTDPLLIIRILSSLLRNAIKHADGDAIDIEVYEGISDPHLESVRLVIEVCDRGQGIPEGTQAKILERANSVTLKSEWTDTGFSLPACLQMARAAGAEVRIESEPHEGCVVSFLFNATPSAKITLHHPTPDSVASLHILVVDDYPPARQTLQQRLESWGHRVSLATQGEEALAMWKEQPERYAAIITDCTMPVMDGYELTRQIRLHEQREGRRATPVFGLTAMSSTEAAASCIDAGMDEYLEKPLTPQKLQETLERYFASAGKAETTVDDKTYQLHLEMIKVNHDDAEHLRQRLEQRERDKVGRMAHRINGGARMMNFMPLKEACEALEVACNNMQSWETIESLAEDVLAEMGRFGRWLEFKE